MYASPQAEKWMDDLHDTTEEQTRVLLLGNKSDLLETRQVTPEEAHDLASTYGVEYMECSAKTGYNIDQAFQKLGRSIKKTSIDSHDSSKKEEQDRKLKISQRRWREKCC